MTTEILTDTVSAKRVIGVAAYNTRFSWNSLAGPVNEHEHVRTADRHLGLFSSRGPRRNCSNLAKCPPIMKPEITAPGAMIGAAYVVRHRARQASAQSRHRSRRRAHVLQRHQHGHAARVRRGRADAAGEPDADAGSGEGGAVRDAADQRVHDQPADVRRRAPRHAGQPELRVGLRHPRRRRGRALAAAARARRSA